MQRLTTALLSVCAGLAASAWGQSNLVINSFDASSGELTFNEVENATNYFVLQSTDMIEGWNSAGNDLEFILPSGTGTITCQVPVSGLTCFYKVGADISNPSSIILLGMEMADIAAAENKAMGMLADLHYVNIDAFTMGKYEVTKQQWDTVKDWAQNNGYSYFYGYGKATNHPVCSVDWYDAVRWCNALSEMEGLTPCYTVNDTVYRSSSEAIPDCDWTANGYRLPTEAEWEWAGRGGLSGNVLPWNGSAINHVSVNYYAYRYADYDGSTCNDPTYHPDYAVGGSPYTSPVGAFTDYDNAFGMYDVVGNVSEWCWDWYSEDYDKTVTDNPRGPATGSSRVARGGSWADFAYYCIVPRHLYAYGSPSYGYSDIGFRVARTPDAEAE